MKDGKGQRTFSIRTGPFQSWFADPAETRAAIRWLQQSQLLVIKDGAKADPHNLEWAVTFPKLGGRGHRCYQFRGPRSLSSKRAGHDMVTGAICFSDECH